MAGVRSQLVSLEAQLLELKSQIGAAQSQNANLVQENFALMQIEKHTTEIMNSQNVELSKMKSEIRIFAPGGGPCCSW
jgi:regulator of replication initiation timing